MKRYDENLLKAAVDCALSSGAKEVIAKLVQEDEHQIRFSNSSIDVTKEWNRYYLDIFMSSGHPFGIGKKINTVTIQDPSIKKITSMLPKEVRILKGLPRSKLYWGMDKTTYKDYPKVKGLYDNRIENMSQIAPELVKETIHSATEAGAKKVAGVLYFGKTRKGLLTGYGNGGVYTTSHCNATIRSFYDEKSSGQGLVATRNLSGLKRKLTDAGKRSGELAKQGADGKEGKAGKYDLIMSPTVAANIFGSVLGGANPLTMIMGMSCLKGKLKEKIGPDTLSVTDDPLVHGGMNSRPFDSEGTPSERTPLVKDGIFTGLIHNTSTAKLWKAINYMKLKFWVRAKTTSNSNMGIMGMTGTENDPRALMPAASNFVFKPGSYSMDELISSSSRPTIYMTSNWYTRFTNMREGKFSTVPRDAMFLVEKGEIKEPVRNLRLAENLLDMCTNIDAMGKDLEQIMWWEVNTPTFIPYIKIKNCNFTRAMQ